jgi:hypothetical protein
LAELVFSYGLSGGVGYLVAGWVGFWCGLGLLTAGYGRLIWLSSRSPVAGGGAGNKPDA